MINRALFLLVLVLFTGVACSEQGAQSDYKSEANALCNAFNPATWGVDFQKMTPVKKATMLQKKIQAAIQSEPMKKVYQTLITDGPDKAYTNYVKNVSDLIGAPHKCQHVKDYFSLSFE